MSENQGASNVPPEQRKFEEGDQVQLKGGTGPKMIVTDASGGALIKCAYWDKDKSEFGFVSFHRSALAYFGDPTPGNSEPVQSTRQLTTTAHMLRTAIRNGRSLIGNHTRDFQTLEQCFEVIVGEVQAHTGITA